MLLPSQCCLLQRCHPFGISACQAAWLERRGRRGTLPLVPQAAHDEWTWFEIMTKKKSGRPPGRPKKRGLNAGLAAVHAKRKAERAAAALASNDHRRCTPPQQQQLAAAAAEESGGGLDAAPPQTKTNSVEAVGAESRSRLCATGAQNYRWYWRQQSGRGD